MTSKKGILNKKKRKIEGFMYDLVCYGRNHLCIKQ
jgi:hypothetical protein